MDLHLGYPFALGPVTINFLLDIFQIFNAQRPIFLDETYNTARVPGPELHLRTGGPDDDALQPVLQEAARADAADVGAVRDADVVLKSVAQEAVSSKQGAGRRPASSLSATRPSAAAKKSPRAAATAPGRSIGVRCAGARGSSRASSRGSPPSMAWESAGGVSASGVAHDDERRNRDLRKKGARIRPVAHRRQVRLDGLGLLPQNDPLHALDEIAVSRPTSVRAAGATSPRRSAATPAERTVAIASSRLARPASSSAAARVSTRPRAFSFSGRRLASARAT